MSQVIQLQPGAVSSARRDWSPIAQPEDRHGIIAHTPNPAGYHNMGGRTMIPRGTQHGGSLGFDGRPGVVNIDPADPVAGTGGITLDLSQVTKEGAAAAVSRANGNAMVAWATVANTQPASSQTMSAADQGVRLAPPMPGYMVPQSTVGGSQIYSQPQAASLDPVAQVMHGSPQMSPAGIVPVVSKAVKPRKGSAMIPQIQGMEQQTGSYQEFAQPHPQATHPQATQPQQAPQAWVGHPIGPTQYPPAQPHWMYAPPQAPQPDPMQQMMLQTMQQMMETLQSLKAASATAPAVAQALPMIPPPPTYTGTADAAEKPVVHSSRLPDEPSDPIPTGLEEFIPPIPIRPRKEVIFDLGKGGKHLKKFHHIAMRGLCLSLIYDSRYDGDQFVPAETDEGETIGIQLPESGAKLRVQVPNFHQRIGCLDILNFIIDQEASQPSVAQQAQEMGFGLGG